MILDLEELRVERQYAHIHTNTLSPITWYWQGQRGVRQQSYC